jgi:GR25 family glycosyltransferase involved in LPS biosynthesis
MSDLLFKNRNINVHDDNSADVKILQYVVEDDDKIEKQKRVDLKEALQTHFTSDIDNNCIVINIEQDVERYKNIIKEINKISCDKFVHLKATYWKEHEKLESDATSVLNFLKNFIPDMETSQIKIDEFSDINDKNIYIQDGPLGCYCSHLRAMIYGYLNFDKYTIVVEDDAVIVNTELLYDCITKIPSDWDIICGSAMSKKALSIVAPFYKFTSPFHSTHFYIIKNSCMPTLFAGMYPIYDQVDVLISNLIYKLNIYNVQNVVYQKSISTNTQNNLHVIHTSPNYSVIREKIEEINRYILFFVDLILPSNDRNVILASNIMFDVIYTYIVSYEKIFKQKNAKKKLTLDVDKKYLDCVEYNHLYRAIFVVMSLCVKGLNIDMITNGLINNILNTILEFDLHNTIDLQTEECIKAYDYGSTSHVYKLEKSDVIIKKYDEEMRWVKNDTDTSKKIFEDETIILLKYNPSIKYDAKDMIIKSEYMGRSLYDEFNLPLDWKEQIVAIFEDLTNKNIYYPEFRIQNILVSNGKLHFVDFGSARLEDSFDPKLNDKNCLIFIELLTKLNDKFKDVSGSYYKRLLYMTFMNNIKTHNMIKYFDNVF